METEFDIFIKDMATYFHDEIAQIDEKLNEDDGSSDDSPSPAQKRRMTSNVINLMKM
jgi:hypothetical protein